MAGSAAWTGVAALTGLPDGDPALLAAAGLGALLPDIDHPNSWFGRRVRAVSVPLAMLVGHRGITHSLLAVAACAALLAWGGWGLAAAPVVVGYLSHLACDALTISGVPLLWPVKRPFGLPLVRTGSATEMAFAALMAAGTGSAFVLPPA